MFRKPTLMLTAASSPAASPAHPDSEYNRQPQQTASVEVLVAAGSPTFSLQPEQSNDKIHWYATGPAITAPGLSVVSHTLPQFRVNLTAVSGGAVSVVCS